MSERDDAMSIDELREAIWEHLFQIKAARSVDEIVAHFNCDAADVYAAITHDWFSLAGNLISIAYTAPTHNKRSNYVGFWE